jgi:hypothetical protein
VGGPFMTVLSSSPKDSLALSGGQNWIARRERCSD